VIQRLPDRLLLGLHVLPSLEDRLNALGGFSVLFGSLPLPQKVGIGFVDRGDDVKLGHAGMSCT
jgi:hypothetical protein